MRVRLPKVIIRESFKCMANVLCADDTHFTHVRKNYD